MTQVDSASDARTANNGVRHQYRVLSEAEKINMVLVKDAGATFLNLLDELRTPPVPVEGGMAIGTIDRELNIARERVEEAVMWAVKHITAAPAVAQASTDLGAAPPNPPSGGSSVSQY